MIYMMERPGGGKMKRRRIRPIYIFALFWVTYMAFWAISTNGESLWTDHNPYAPLFPVKNGDILKLTVDEPVVVDLEYENKGDEDVVLKMAPDKKHAEFLEGTDWEKSITRNQKKKIRWKNRLRFVMAVEAVSMNGDVVTFNGSRIIATEQGDTELNFRVSGRIQKGDIDRNRTIHSNNVADLQLAMRAKPIPGKTAYDVKTTTNPDGTTQEEAKLSDTEKARIAMEYLNRILGETGEN